MKSRSLFLTIAAGLLVSGIGALDARATPVTLPVTYDALLPPGTTTTVVGAETLTFSNFGYGSSTTAGSTTTLGVPPASLIQVNAFAVGVETGLSFGGTLQALANTVVDVQITYAVTAPAGELLTDAFLGSAGSPIGGTGTGSYTIGETLTTFPGLAPVASLTAGSSSPTQTVSFTGVQSIFVTKDIAITGGSTGESLSVIQQGFSSSGVPEPTSVALLGIGMTGFLVFRRLFKRTSVA